jgi:lysophospholipase L1-like esterase
MSVGPRRGDTVRRLGLLTVITALALGGVGMATASAQGDPVGGAGNQYLVPGVEVAPGAPADEYRFGRRSDDVYVGDFVRADGSFGSDGTDDVVIRRGNTYTVRGQADRSFTFGNREDTVLAGDWDGDGDDTLAVRRGNAYSVSNDLSTGAVDHVVVFGDPTDTVLVGNWDGDTSAAGDAHAITTDTLMVRRGNHYFVTNSTTTGVADYDFWFGDESDTVLVGDWACLPGDGSIRRSGDYADSLAARRGNAYFMSEEVWTAAAAQPRGRALRTEASFTYGDSSDTAFAVQSSCTSEVDGVGRTVYGDGIGLRRNDVATGAAPVVPAPVVPAPVVPAPVVPPPGIPTPWGSAMPAARTYVAVGDSITAGREPQDRLDALGATSWLHGETTDALQLVGGWAVSGATTADMRAGVVPTPADVLVLLGGTNDLLRGVPWEATEANLEAISATVGARETLLVGIVPITEFPAERAEFNARLAALAGVMGWRYVDPWTPIAQGDAWMPTATWDNLHPTPDAAIIAGRTIADEAWEASAQRAGR